MAATKPRTSATSKPKSIARARGAGDTGRRRTADEGTRSAVLQAALDTICDMGYYQASSNEIARRAGVSWGVIQYYFGSREALLLAVLEDAVDRGVAVLEDVEIAGNELRLRLRQLFNLVMSFYGRREYAAILQILWNLSRDARTEESSADALIDFSNRLTSQWRDLFHEAAGADRSDQVASMAFLLMWGVAMEEAANEFMKQPGVQKNRTSIELRSEMLLDALEGMLSHERA